jgi:hypothetical protein
MKKNLIVLKTGILITQDKNGNILSLKSPYDKEKTYGDQCVENLKSMFKTLQSC